MIPYICIFLLFLIGVYFDSFKQKAPKNIYFYFLLIAAILFAGLRDMIGGYDIYVYSEVYEAPIEEIFLYSSFENGFKYFFVVLKQISDKREFMIFMISLVMTIMHYYVLKRHSTNFFLSLFIFFCKFYLMSFVYLRQGIAMGIVWLSIPLILNRKFLPFLFTTALAFTFHKSSIVFFPLYFIANFNFKRNHYLIFPILALIFSVSPLSTSLMSLIGEELDSRYSHYTDQSTTFNVFYLIESVILTYLLVKYSDKLKQYKYGLFLNNALFVYIILNMIAITNATYIRFIWYYLVFVALALPIYIQIGRQTTITNARLFKPVLMLYFTALFFRLLIIWDNGDLMPYQTYFSEESRGGRFEHMEYRKLKNLE